MNLILQKTLTPFFQLQYSDEKEVVGAEILMRSSLGNIAEVVQFYENLNCAEDIDLLAFSYALKFKEQTGYNVSSNFSGQSLEKQKVLETLQLCKGGEQVKIEVTETASLSPDGVKNIAKLAMLGFEISLDDYGSDKNNLNRWVELPISEIKIDKFICDRLFLNSRAKKSVQGTLHTALLLDCEVVVEGVESQKQFKFLKDLGVTKFQGYYFHKPEEFILN